MAASRQVGDCAARETRHEPATRPPEIGAWGMAGRTNRDWERMSRVFLAVAREGLRCVPPGARLA